jgi:hypothetical protein
VESFLKKLQLLRGHDSRDAVFFRDIQRVKQWQHQRLVGTYADLAANPRYAPATAFFLDELYGGKDSALRDRDLCRMAPTMKRLLPGFAYRTVEMALELDVISEEFDQRMARVLGAQAIDEARYIDAFRQVDGRAERLKQVALMQEVGKQLDHVVKKPLIFSTLKMLRNPARMAGLANMQQFLEAGFSAFKHMNGADVFLQTIAERESLLIERILGGHQNPFSLVQ